LKSKDADAAEKLAKEKLTKTLRTPSKRPKQMSFTPAQVTELVNTADEDERKEKVC